MRAYSTEVMSAVI